MGLIGHLRNYSVAFAMHIYVHYNNRANEIIFNIPGLFSPINFLNSKKKHIKKCRITYSDIIKQILRTKNNQSILHHPTLYNQ